MLTNVGIQWSYERWFDLQCILIQLTVMVIIIQTHRADCNEGGNFRIFFWGLKDFKFFLVVLVWDFYTLNLIFLLLIYESGNFIYKKKYKRNFCNKPELHKLVCLANFLHKIYLKCCIASTKTFFFYFCIPKHNFWFNFSFFCHVFFWLIVQHSLQYFSDLIFASYQLILFFCWQMSCGMKCWICDAKNILWKDLCYSWGF